MSAKPQGVLSRMAESRAQRERPEVSAQASLTCRCSRGRRYRGQSDSTHNQDNCDHHEELDEGKAAAMHDSQGASENGAAIAEASAQR